MTEWQKYTKSRRIRKHTSDFYVIVPDVTEDSHPLFCLVCDRIMRTKLDDEAHEKFKCCDSCATYWAYPNKSEWLNGWRPSSEEVKNKYEVLHT